MSLRQLKAYKAIAVVLAFSFAQVYIQIGLAESSVPMPQQFVARLTTRGNQPITVNGASAGSGATILTGATIETPDQVGATIDLGSLGTLDLAPNTKIMLEFDDNGHVKVRVIVGCVIFKPCKKGDDDKTTDPNRKCRKDVDAQVETPQGPAAKSDSKKNGGAVDVCFGGGGAQPLVNVGAAANAGAGAGGAAGAVAGGAAGAGGLSTAAKWWLFGGIAFGTTLVIILATRGHNPSP